MTPSREIAAWMIAGIATICARVHWTPKIGDDVYVVWNSGYTTIRAYRSDFRRGALSRDR